MRLIVDTNVLVSAVGGRGRGAPPALLVEAVLSGRFTLTMSAELWQEYVDVLRRPSLLRWAGLTEAEVRTLLEAIVIGATWLVPPRCALACPDPADQHLWDLLAAEADVLLITGERALLEGGAFPGRVLLPRQAIERLRLV